MTIRPYCTLRAVFSVACAALIFALFAAVLPATSAAQPPGDTAVDVTLQGPPPPPPPPPPTDCAAPWPSYANHRKVYATQQDAAAGYAYGHDTQTFGNDEIVNYDSAHPESLEQRSIITDAVYDDDSDADGLSPRTVLSTFGMTTKSYQYLADGQADHGDRSFAELEFQQMVSVTADEAWVRFDSALIETVLESGSAFGTDPVAVFYVLRYTGDGGDVVHASSIFDHEFVETWPNGAASRTIDVPLDPDTYIVGVAMESGVDADGPGLSKGVNYLDLYASWTVDCEQPEPAPIPAPLASRGTRGARVR